MADLPRVTSLTIPPTMTGLGVANGAGLQGLGNTITAMSVDEINRRRRLEDAVTVANGVAEFTGALTKERIDLRTDPDYLSHPQRFQDFATQKRDEILGLMPNDEARAEAMIRMAPLMESNILSVYDRTDKLHTSELQAQAGARRDLFAQAATMADDPQTRALSIGNMVEDIRNDPTLTPLQAQQEIKRRLVGIQTADFLRGSQAIATAETPRQARAAAAATLQGIDESDLDPVARERARLTTISEFNQAQNRFEVEGRRAERDAREQIATSLLGRITSGDIKTMPSQADIIAAPLLRTRQRADLIALRAKTLRGQATVSNPLVLDQAFRDVHSGKITTDEQLVDLVTQGGVSMTDYRHLSADRKAMERPERQDQFRQLDDMLSIAKGVMAPSTILKSAQPAALVRYGLFEKRLRDRFNAEIDAGKDPRQTILNPDSPDYFGAYITPMDRREQMAAGRKAFETQQSLPPEQRRKEGQSAEDFLKEGGP